MTTASTESISGAGRITATPAARAAISRLRAARGAPVMFVQSGGCCAGSTPMCLPAGELIVGARDVLLGEIDGCPSYIDDALDAAWRRGTAGDGLRSVTAPSDVAGPSASTERSAP